MTAGCEVIDNTKEIYKTYKVYRIMTVQSILNILDTMLWIIFTQDKFICRPKVVCI
jgi:hypothetical protein